MAGEETVEAVFEQFSIMFEDLSHRRAAGTDEASAMRAFIRHFRHHTFAVLFTDCSRKSKFTLNSEFVLGKDF